jgi:hypothetical protein
MIVASANDATKTILATILAAILAAPSLVTLVLVVRSFARLRGAFPVALLERARFRDIAAPAFFAPAPSRSSGRDRRSNAFDRYDRRSVDRVPGPPSPRAPNRCAAARRDATPHSAGWRPRGPGARATSAGHRASPRRAARPCRACASAPCVMFGTACLLFASSPPRGIVNHFFSEREGRLSPS